MCQRKIISKSGEWTVPLLNGCNCPMIKEFHHVNGRPKREHKMPEGCYDIHTQIPAEITGYHMVFRHCDCNHESGVCMKMPPLLFPMAEFSSVEQDDEDEDTLGGTCGMLP